MNNGTPAKTWNFMTMKDSLQSDVAQEQGHSQGIFDLISDLCSGCCDFHVARPNNCPKLWATGHAGAMLTNFGALVQIKHFLQTGRKKNNGLHQIVWKYSA